MGDINDAITANPANAQAIKLAAYGVQPTPENNLTAGTRMVSIIDGPVIEKGCVKVTLALWIDFGFGMELQDLGDRNPFYFKNPPVLVPDDNGEVVRTSEDPRTHVVTERRYREDLEAALMQMACDALESFVGTGGEM